MKRLSATCAKNAPLDFPLEKSFLLVFAEDRCRVVLKRCVNVIGRKACALA